MRHQVVEEGGFHLFFQIDIPGGAGVGHHDDGGRDLAVLDQLVGRLQQVALDGPIVARAIIAVQQIHHRVAQLAVGVIASWQIDVVGPAALQGRAVEFSSLDAASPHRCCAQSNACCRYPSSDAVWTV
ncbi:hypothetical protein D3C72_1158980 [compost metagenome]